MLVFSLKKQKEKRKGGGGGMPLSTFLIFTLLMPHYFLISCLLKHNYKHVLPKIANNPLNKILSGMMCLPH